MPIYDFKCSTCGHTFDVMQKMSDPPPPCPAEMPEPKGAPECGGETVKQISRSSFHLKGTGWYATDYKD